MPGETPEAVFMLNKYNDKKPRNQAMYKMLYKHVGEKTVERVKDCNSFMSFIADKDSGKLKQVAGNSCKNRFCPICMFRMSRKDALKIQIMIQHLKEKHDMAFIMATFTAPNVKGHELKNEIDRFSKASKKMMERKEVVNMNKGYIRKLEVTYNSDPVITKEMWNGSSGRKPMKEYFKRKGLKIGDANPNYDTYHTHYHVIFAVKKSYFKDSRSYISQDRWLNLWREAMDDVSITQVDVRKLKMVDGKGGDVSEIAKYVAKDSDYLISQEVFDVFYTSLKGRQIITYNKLFKEANKMYKAGELDHYKTPDTTEYVNMLYYTWGGKVYNETERRALTEEEKVEYNGHLVNEIEIDSG